MGQLLGGATLSSGVGEGGEEKEKELPPGSSSESRGRGSCGRGGRGSSGLRAPLGAGARGGPPTKVFTPRSYPLKV
jgi:hypothetical protein